MAKTKVPIITIDNGKTAIFPVQIKDRVTTFAKMQIMFIS